MKPGVLARLTFCLGMLLGSSRMFAEEAHGGLGASDSAEWNQAQAESTGSAADGGIGKIVKGDGANIEIGVGNPGQSVTGDGNAPKPEEGEAAESADGPGEIPVRVGECTGKRFKKCR